MADNLIIFGQQYPNATGIKAKNTDGNTEIFVKSDWTKVRTHELSLNYTDTTSAKVKTFTGSNSIWTSDKILYIRIRDEAGIRPGYFYGSDNFFINICPAYKPSQTTTTLGIRTYYRCTADGALESGISSGSSANGIWVQSIQDNGYINIYALYSETYSKTINGDYLIEAYLLNPAGGVPLFE